MPRWPLLAWLVALAFWPWHGARAEHAVILLYHRVADTGPAATRVTPERFAAHLDIISSGNYRVLPLQEILDGIYGDATLPERAIAISFDDAYRSVAEVAYPMLREREMPFTVFVATDAVDKGFGSFVGWDALRALAREGLATFGGHSLSHRHLESPEPTSANRHTSRAGEIDGSMARLREELGDAVIDAFAYPYGEYSLETESLIADRHLAGLAQQSGALGPGTPTTRIPRFPFYVGGDSNARLQTALDTQPLPLVAEDHRTVLFTPSQTLPTNWSPRFGEGAYQRGALRCYAASGETLPQQWIEDSLRVALPSLRPGRNKVNCTAPATRGSGYFWYSRLWIHADAEGRWLRE